ncbi:hypothetical protein PanWU01x14_347480 [Parasponia andersonii]|uniref:Uncharacterized protein n=1 Tax=Parasponia andersonii TaxID=3476 RepID=A0A2P5ABY2_PARAD|nr:hypothetical protein PanWU01x14_347480 [Parasponia andersonii]
MKYALKPKKATSSSKAIVSQRANIPMSLRKDKGKVVLDEVVEKISHKGKASSVELGLLKDVHKAAKTS